MEQKVANAALAETPLLPQPATLERVVVETAAADLKSFYLKFNDGRRWDYLPGQFAELSLYGYGEAPIGMASSPTEGDHLMFTVFNTGGAVSRALHRLAPGAKVGLRGPLGNTWPLEELRGKNATVIGGGFAFTTQRSLIKYILANRKDFAELTVVYGARSPGALLYKPELAEWEKSPELTLHLTVDKGDETWAGREGFVPTVVEEEKLSPDNAIALICGPPIMIKFTLPVMDKLGWRPEQIYTSLEMRMKCGVGMCGRCNVGPKYVCVDGPVFSFAELSKLPPEY
ncbi:MAG: heterodisulfide reductase subunit F [candidate division Zixibacteria bacterium]|nr:heterodisulfide reductase subunit F [candidate division Zixibacteria bacterium]